MVSRKDRLHSLKSHYHCMFSVLTCIVKMCYQWGCVCEIKRDFTSNNFLCFPFCLFHLMTWPESSKSYAHQRETTGSSNDSIQLRTFPKSERSGSVVECLTRDRRFEPHRRHCVVILEQDTFILA